MHARTQRVTGLDFIPSKTKVLHLTENPYLIACREADADTAHIKSYGRSTLPREILENERKEREILKKENMILTTKLAAQTQQQVRVDRGVHASGGGLSSLDQRLEIPTFFSFTWMCVLVCWIHQLQTINNSVN